MAAERDAFGFYFSAHPVDSQRHLLAAHKVRSFAELSSIRAPAEGGRSATMMAGLVEGVRWRTSAKGRRYMMATISDAIGQYEATAFDDEPSAELEAAAKAGGCGLMTVELDRRPGEDTPRVTVKRFQPLDGLAKRTRLQMNLTIADPAALPAVARELRSRGGTGAVRATVPISDGARRRSLLGRDFHARRRTRRAPHPPARRRGGRTQRAGTAQGWRWSARPAFSTRPARPALPRPATGSSAAGVGYHRRHCSVAQRLLDRQVPRPPRLGRRRGRRLIFLARQIGALDLARRRRLVLGRGRAGVDAGVEPVAPDLRRPARRWCCRSGG